ncbi:unnamed protein product, partial [Brassica rapa]
MDPNKAEMSRLEALPQGLLGEIATTKKKKKKKKKEIATTTCSCKELYLSSFFFPNYTSHLRTTIFSPLVKKPLLATRYTGLMLRCLAKNNPEAHYIRGILKYFHSD